MNIEDKKALESVKDMFADVTIKDIDEQSITLYGVAMLDVIRVLDIVDRQQEQIKNFKIEDKNIYLQFGEILERKKWKDKIKVKIEEINKEMLNEENSLELFYRKKYCKEVLQSLFEKE